MDRKKLFIPDGMNALTEDMIYERYRLIKMNFQEHMRHLTVEEHIILYHVLASEEEKVFLKELAEFLQVKMSDLSPVVKELSDRGLVKWTHDKETPGTYIMLTDLGTETLKKQEESLNKAFSKVYERIGEEKLKEYFKLMHEVNSIVKEAFEPDEIEALEA